jgi:hypothetical protein
LLVGKSEPSVGLVGTAIVAADGYVNGNTGDTEGYDANTNAWTTLKSDPIARSATCAGGIGSQPYVAGGFGGVGSTESFKLSKNTWKTRAMPQASSLPGSVV